MMPWLPFYPKWLPFTLLVMAAAAACARLGAWQLDRLSQRRASNARMAHITSLPPVDLPASESLADQEYRAVRVRGVFDFHNQVALRNQARGAEYGYHLLTPLVVQENEAGSPTNAVLVDRGWIPAAGNEEPEDWRKYDSPGPVLVEGVIRRGRHIAGSDADGGASAAAGASSGRFFLAVDPAQILDRAGYPRASTYVQASAAHDQTALPAAEVLRLDLGDGPHLGYAIQWFVFALTLLAGYAVYVHKHEVDRA
jgi:surfeit locus 1 family protein